MALRMAILGLLELAHGPCPDVMLRLDRFLYSVLARGGAVQVELCLPPSSVTSIRRASS